MALKVEHLSKTISISSLLLNLMAFGVFYAESAGRYDACSRNSACCRHEVCAYNRICYPTVKCRYGCPDGDCIYEEKTGYEYCWPFRPCNSSFECPLGNTCSMHFNLGYNTCQYNLGIGSSLCYKKRSFWVYILAQNKTGKIGTRVVPSSIYRGQGRKYKSNAIVG